MSVTVIVVTGVQAAGKSSVAQALAERPDRVAETVEEILTRMWTEAAI